MIIRYNQELTFEMQTIIIEYPKIEHLKSFI